MSQKYKNYEQKDEDDSFEAGFEIPQTKSVLNSLQNELAFTHRQEEEENEKQGKPKKQKRGGVICCCGVPHCGIGPFVGRS